MFIDRIRVQAICNVALWTAFGVILGWTIYASLVLGDKLDTLIDRVKVIEDRPATEYDIKDGKFRINNGIHGSKQDQVPGR